MNTLSTEEIQRLREAFERGLGVRAAARAVGVNRETCGRYFKDWSQNFPQDPIERAKHFRLIADMEEWLTRFPPERALVLRAAFYSGLARPRSAKLADGNLQP